MQIKLGTYHMHSCLVPQQPTQDLWCEEVAELLAMWLILQGAMHCKAMQEFKCVRNLKIWAIPIVIFFNTYLFFQLRMGRVKGHMQKHPCMLIRIVSTMEVSTKDFQEWLSGHRVLPLQLELILSTKYILFFWAPFCIMINLYFFNACFFPGEREWELKIRWEELNELCNCGVYFIRELKTRTGVLHAIDFLTF